MTESARRVGVEIEFTGLDVIGAARIAADTLGGEVERISQHVATVRGSELGELGFELDTRYAKPPSVPGAVDSVLDALHARETAADMLSAIVPVELVTPPLERAQLDVLDRLLAALAREGAEGTRAHPVNAFGMHLNPELDPCEPRAAMRIAAAYAFCETWLRGVLRLDLSRRATPFVDPYPTGYLRALVDAMADGRLPPFAGFVELYAEWNPTRNRGLDMWPLLGHLDRGTAESALGHPIKGARPAFHYRLPDCRIDEPGWSPRDDLDLWDRIAAIGADPHRLDRARTACDDLIAWRSSRASYDARIAELIGPLPAGGAAVTPRP